MYKNRKISLIILMAGHGERFQSDIPKQFHRLGGKQVYLHTLDFFLTQEKVFDEIVLVCPKFWQPQVLKDTSTYPKKVKVITGGQSRQQSSFLGLCACTFKDIVMIHDAVRPFITEKIIFDNLDLAIKKGAVDTCICSQDTLVEIKNREEIEKIPNRSKFLRGQTPQTFSYPLICKAHELAQKEKITNASDDCSLLSLVPHKIFIVMGSESNIKITSPLDLYLAEQLLRLHTTSLKEDKAFSLKGKRFIILGATGGIGKSLSQLLQKEKTEVIPLSKSTKPAIDLMSKESMEKALKKIFKKYGAVDGLINCAGILHVKPLIKSSFDEIFAQIQTNLTGLIYTAKLAKIKKGGHLVFLASSSFTRGRKNSATYSATKAGVVNFTQALSEEFPNLFVNTLAPARTDTLMRRKNFPSEDQNLLLSPETVAQKIVELLKSFSITGCVIEVKK